jgi:hypothetical protein
MKKEINPEAKEILQQIINNHWKSEIKTN